MIFRHTHYGVSDKDNNVSFEDFDIHYHISSYGLAAIPVIMSVSAHQPFTFNHEIRLLCYVLGLYYWNTGKSTRHSNHRQKILGSKSARNVLFWFKNV
jgi:hypothetical protein